MIQNDSTVWDTQITRQFAEALVDIDNIQTMQNFLRDVMTQKEIIEISARLEAARMLTAGDKYTDITNKTKLSSRTVARISDWLKNGDSGYKTAIDNINKYHTHIPPACTE